MIPFIFPMVGHITTAGSLVENTRVPKGDMQGGSDSRIPRGDMQSGSDVRKTREIL